MRKNRRFTRRKRWVLSYCPGFLELVPEGGRHHVDADLRGETRF
jgi:hypothetical protein